MPDTHIALALALLRCTERGLHGPRACDRWPLSLDFVSLLLFLDIRTIYTSWKSLYPAPMLIHLEIFSITEPDYHECDLQLWLFRSCSISLVSCITSFAAREAQGTLSELSQTERESRFLIKEMELMLIYAV